MNDEMKGKSGKVKVMYVRSDDDSNKRTHNPRTGKGCGRPAKSRADGGRRPAAMTSISPVTAVRKIRRGARLPARR
ncbi:hypothetical protein ACNKHU_15725 [Shigella flexneri]